MSNVSGPAAQPILHHLFNLTDFLFSSGIEPMDIWGRGFQGRSLKIKILTQIKTFFDYMIYLCYMIYLKHTFNILNF